MPILENAFVSSLKNPPIPPKLNRECALFVLGKIDEILAWEQRKDTERDTKFVELGRYLCEVQEGQYWRLEKLKSFDEFLTIRFPESRRKAYYLMSIHENQPPQEQRKLKEIGWTKGLALAIDSVEGSSEIQLCNLVAQRQDITEGSWNGS